MSSRKGSKHFGEKIIDQVFVLREEGKTHHEIAEIFGLRNAMASQNLIKRYYKRKRNLEQGILPRRKGRPSKATESLYEENQRSKKEIEILTFFTKLSKGSEI